MVQSSETHIAECIRLRSRDIHPEMKALTLRCRRPLISASFHRFEQSDEETSPGCLDE